MPVRIWMMSNVIEALPKTYHQPIGPAAPRGIGWVSIGRMLSLKARRKSSHRPKDVSQPFILDPPGGHSNRGEMSCRVFQGILQCRIVRRLDLELILPNAPDATE